METQARRLKPKRKTSRRHPLLQGRPKNVWHGDIAHLMPHYPQTQWAFEKLQARCRRQVIKANAEGKAGSRKNVPDGYAGRRDEVLAIRALAAEQAKELMNKMAEKGMLDENAHANTSLEFAAGVVLAGDVYPIGERLKAARLVLDFTKAKPAQKQEVTIKKAEDFLEELAGDDDK